MSEASSHRVPYLLQRGDDQLRVGNPAAAVGLFSAVLDLVPDHPEALFGLGCAREQWRDWGAASALYLRAREHGGDRVRLDRRLATVLVLAGRDTEASEVLERVLADDPEDASAWSDLGHARLGRGRLDAAQKAFERAVDLDSDLVHGWCGLAHHARILGEAPRALAHATHAMGLAPEDPQPRLIAGVLELQLGRVEPAGLHAQAALSGTREPPDLLAAAEILEEVGETVTAQHLYRQIRRQHPANAADHAALAEAEARLGHLDRAQALVRRALELHPESGELIATSLAILIETGQEPAVRRELKRFLALGPHHPDLTEGVLVALSDALHLREARAVLDRASREGLDPRVRARLLGEHPLLGSLPASSAVDAGGLSS